MYSRAVKYIGRRDDDEPTDETLPWVWLRTGTYTEGRGYCGGTGPV